MSGVGVIIPIILITVYAVVLGLSLLVLWRLVILLPILTTLAVKAHDALPQPRDENLPERRLLEIEDLLRLNRITQAEYAAKRQEILNDL